MAPGPRNPSSFGQSFYEGGRTRNREIVRRRIPPEVGRGLEKLGHALEYLTDEFVIEGCRFAEDHGRLDAIQLLASLNRQIYFACDVEPRFRDRVQTVFRRLLNS